MNPTQHECPDCGYTWLHGQHGGHSCKDRLLAKIAEQARDIASKQAVPPTMPWGGITVLRNDDLPAQTMIVSRDVFELLKSQGVKS